MIKLTNRLTTVNSIFAVIGTVIAKALGGWDLALQVLVALVVLDYITGVVIAVCDKTLSSAIGGKGIANNLFIFALVYVAALADQAMSTELLRIATIMFYIANEGISVLENAGKLGVPYPAQLKNILVQLKTKSNGEGDTGANQ